MNPRTLLNSLLGSCVFICSCSPELESKLEWSTLQSVEQQRREKAGRDLEFVTMGKDVVVGIPVEDDREKVWVLLNPRHPPYYKQVPKGNYSLSVSNLNRILTNNALTSTVLECLNSHVEHKPRR